MEKSNIFACFTLCGLVFLMLSCSKENNKQIELLTDSQTSCGQQRKNFNLGEVQNHLQLPSKESFLALSINGQGSDQSFQVVICDSSNYSTFNISQKHLTGSDKTIYLSLKAPVELLSLVEIYWSDGAYTSIRRAPSNQIITIKHPINNPGRSFNLTQTIIKSLEYAQKTELAPIEILMLERLVTNYQLAGFPDVKQRYLSLIDNAPNSFTKSQLEIASRIMDKNRTSSSEAVLNTPWPDIVIFSALHCDRVPLSSDTSELWQNEIKQGGYRATHILLAYKWALDNRCKIPNLPADFIETAVDLIIKNIDDTNGMNDLEMEALCWIALVDQEQKIKPNWVKQIIEQQLADGGWADQPSIKTSNPHSSGLATWLLLDLHYYNQSFSTHIDI